MAEHYFLFPFAVSGNVAPVPNPTQVAGTVSYQSGFPVGYELPNTNPGYLSIPRDQFNQLMNDITAAMQAVQQRGFASWITSAANGGTPFPYAAGAQVWGPDNNPYQSLINNNTDTPPSSNWTPVVYNASPFSTGDTVKTYNATLPAGWLWVDGSTLGNASSNSTFQGASYQALFNALWASTTNAVCPLLTSAGAAVGARGVSAAADWAANYRLVMPDERGRVGFCADQFPGGTAAGRLTGDTAQGVNGAILANTGGEQSHTPTLNEMFDHVHFVPTKDANTAGGAYQGILSSAGNASTGPVLQHYTADAGASQNFNEIPPAIIKYTRIKL